MIKGSFISYRYAFEARVDSRLIHAEIELIKIMKEEGKDAMLHANGSSSFKCFWRILIDLYSNDSEITRIDEVEESEHWAHSRHLSCER